MMLRLALAVAAAATLSACASTPAPRGELTDAQLASGDTQRVYAQATEEQRHRVFCTREYQVGSNRPVRICQSLAQRNRIQTDSEAAALQAGSRMTPSGQPGDTGAF